MAVQIATFVCVRVAWCQDCGKAVKWQRQQNYDIDNPSVYETWRLRLCSHRLYFGRLHSSLPRNVHYCPSEESNQLAPEYSIRMSVVHVLSCVYTCGELYQLVLYGTLQVVPLFVDSRVQLHNIL